MKILGSSGDLNTWRYTLIFMNHYNFRIWICLNRINGIWKKLLVKSSILVGLVSFSNYVHCGLAQFILYRVGVIIKHTIYYVVPFKKLTINFYKYLWTYPRLRKRQNLIHYRLQLYFLIDILNFPQTTITYQYTSFLFIPFMSLTKYKEYESSKGRWRVDVTRWTPLLEQLSIAWNLFVSVSLCQLVDNIGMEGFQRV